MEKNRPIFPNYVLGKLGLLSPLPEILAIVFGRRELIQALKANVRAAERVAVA